MIWRNSDDVGNTPCDRAKDRARSRTFLKFREAWYELPEGEKPWVSVGTPTSVFMPKRSPTRSANIAINPSRHPCFLVRIEERLGTQQRWRFGGCFRFDSAQQCAALWLEYQSAKKRPFYPLWRRVGSR